MKPRNPSRPGLSIADANRGRLITYQDDVLGVKAEIEKIWAGLLSVFFDEENEEWVIYQHCADGTDQIVFTTQALSQATIDRIHRCDQASRSYIDPNDAYEKMDREEEREKEHNFSEAVGEASERLYFALRKDGAVHRPQVFFSDRGAA